jgi:sulfate adenylyltransferase subunit 2
VDTITRLENTSIEIIREAYACFGKLSVLWSIGKDSTVLLWLIRKAFFGHVPLTLIHVDTTYKIPEMISYRDQVVRDLNLQIIVIKNTRAINEGKTFPLGTVDRTTCCNLLKSTPLAQVLNGEGERHYYDHTRGAYQRYEDPTPFNGAIIGLRADEEGSRSKERYFSPRGENHGWNIQDQPPEFWNQYNTEFAPGTHVRVHPLLDWTELNIWEYIERESIPTVSLYYDQGDGTRYRSLGCYPCTKPVPSTSKIPADIIQELKTGQLFGVPERSGRAQDKEGAGGLEKLRRDGYM